MTDRYAVIGNPIAHSKSPLIHRMFAEQTGQDISYEAVLAPLDGFAATVGRLRKEGYRGCNVTVPFKFEAYKLVSKLAEELPLVGLPTQRAIDARAANTLKFDDGFIVGDNTDGAGLVTDIEHNLGISLHNKRVLLMGAGGAAYGVLQPLLHTKPSHLVIANRTREKADALHQLYAHLSGTEMLAKTYDELDDLQFDVIVNATSAGLSDSTIPLPDTIFAPGALAYDMMYGRETPFMKFAREHGARVADGLGMLVEQAAEAFFIWRGVRPDTVPVIAALRT
ncbi:shikimate dehydrogenase [Candidatus Ferrigenium straubiae]|jgi:shikimate dehydrogenase|uniref:shikimate dehydrogenase n=1 Tax=Candidatus Ferrigenium straubiae TaxID=2919506 RepID=UPI003F4AD84D